jgi:hypothetical protein
MKKIIIPLLLGLLFCAACENLDIPPKNIITDDDLLSNEGGMDIYMARLYSNMPFEDFKYRADRGYNNSYCVAPGIEGTGEALNRDSYAVAFTGESNPYWGSAFTLLRDANHLLETLPEFQGSFPEPTYNHYLGEAYFIRAIVFCALAKRYGGAPLVTSVIQYPAEQEALEVPRSSEEETWDQILADFDRAAELMGKTSLKRGYANKFVALAYKSEAMLYAACVAKYNQTVTGRLTGLGEKTNVRVIGFADDRWDAASKKYFKEAYKAARTIIAEGGYSLYIKKWAAGNRDAQYQNMVDMFSDLTSPENIFVKEYVYPTMTHGHDAYNSPYIFRAPLSSGTCPTLDFLELFEGFERYPDGTVKVTTGNTNTEGTYLLFDSPLDFFKNAEPRLHAYSIFPGEMFRNKEIEVRGGIYTGNEPISPLFSNYSYADAASVRYQNLAAFTDKDNQTLFLSSNSGSNQVIVPLPDGTEMTAAGTNGPFWNNSESCISGIYGRKWLNPDASAIIGEGKSAQPFILMRYAEVLLNIAEAAIELAMAGEPSPVAGDNMLQIATDAVNAIRERAGATLLTGNLTANETGRNTVRKERRKELAFEYKTLWDLRRWRVWHYDGRDGFWGETRDKEVYSSNANYRFRGLYPFYSSQAGKYFFDAHFHWVGIRTYTFSPLSYYFAIPSAEVTKSPFIDQQPNR